VSRRPGHSAFTVTPFDAISRASDLVSPTRPDFVAAYTVWPALPWIATALDMFTILPHFSRSIPRSAACAHRNDPRRFVAIVCS
jgi:hypothetical protein